MTSRNAKQCGFHRHAANGFGFFHGAANRTDRRIQIDNKPFAQTLRFRRAEREEFQMFVNDFRDEHARFRATNVQPYDVFILLRQSALPERTFYFNFVLPRFVRRSRNYPDSAQSAAQTANPRNARSPHLPATAKSFRRASGIST